MSDRDIKIPYNDKMSFWVSVPLQNKYRKIDMTVRKKKILPTVLEGLLYLILAAGAVFLLIVLGIAPSPFVKGKLIFIMPHKIIGYLFYILIL